MTEQLTENEDLAQGPTPKMQKQRLQGKTHTTINHSAVDIVKQKNNNESGGAAAFGRDNRRFCTKAAVLPRKGVGLFARPACCVGG
jgi:hypothetical protein